MSILDKYKECQKIADNYINKLGCPSYNDHWHCLNYTYKKVSIEVILPRRYDFSVNPKGIETKELPNNMDGFQYGISGTQSHDKLPKLFTSTSDCISYIDTWKDGNLTNLNP